MSPPPWETEPHRCRGCVALADAEKEFEDRPGGLGEDAIKVDRRGLTFRWKRWRAPEEET